ncbi:MAG: hypothetical protein ACHQEM_09445, partial [Chitinophagales bacterium]
MNDNLQAIMDRIKQSERLSNEEKSILGKSASEAGMELSKMKRDLEIEASLEVVRERAMSMQKSDELAELVDTVFRELTKLHFNLDRCIISIIHEESRSARWWMANPEVDKTPISYHVRLDENPYFMATFNAWKERKSKWVYDLKGKEKKATVEYIFSKTELRLLPEAARKGMKDTNRIFLSSSFSNFGSLQADTLEPLSEENLDILYRFGKVFDLTYTRFNDLKKAEAQAREAQIESALEKIRSRSLAMHSSEELKDVIAIFFEKLSDLKALIATVGIQLFDKESMHSFVWVGNAIQDPQMIYLPYDKQMMLEDTMLKDCWHAMAQGEDIINKKYTHEQKNKFFEYLFANNDFTQIPETAREVLRQMRSHIICLMTEKNSAILADSWNEQLYSQESLNVLKRAAKVFEQAYIRFLDLQKAEAQARESQIQLAMERVRARTMAMQRSDELVDAANLMFQQIEVLGVTSWNCGFNIWDEDKKHATSWNGSKGGLTQPFKTISSEDVFLHFYDAALRGETLYIEEIGGEACEAHYRYMATLPLVGDLLKGMEAAGIVLPTFQIFHIAYFSQGYLMFITYEPVPELHDIFKRFAKVFEQTYTRFLDLQKAEAQTRESQIQLAMERVRARTMAMQHSSELGEAASLLFKQIDNLGTKSWSSGFDIWQTDRVSAKAWMANPDGSVGMPFIVPYTEDPFFIQILEARQSGKDFFVMESSGKELEETYQYLFNLPDAKKHFDGVTSLGFQMPTFQITHCVFFLQGFLMFITYEPVPEMWDIFKRFARVFEQTYTRFLDLEKAEAQAREAQIETALERVRSRTMAMHRSGEIADILGRMFEELKQLDMVLVRVLIWIFNDNEKYISWWSANAEVETTAKSYRVDYNEHPVFLSVLD